MYSKIKYGGVVFLFSLLSIHLFAQKDSIPSQTTNPALQEIFNSKYPKTYTIAEINIVVT